MNILLSILLGIVIVVIFGWLTITLGAHFDARRQRTLDKVRLGGKFSGLMRFGKPGAYLSLAKSGSQDRFTFTKRAGGCFSYLEVDVSSPLLTSERLHCIRSALSVLDANMRLQAREEPAQEGRFRIRLDGVDEHDSATLEAILRLLVRELGHASGDHYRVEFKGPADYEKVEAYYG